MTETVIALCALAAAVLILALCSARCWRQKTMAEYTQPTTLCRTGSHGLGDTVVDMPSTRGQGTPVPMTPLPVTPASAWMRPRLVGECDALLSPPARMRASQSCQNTRVSLKLPPPKRAQFTPPPLVSPPITPKVSLAAPLQTRNVDLLSRLDAPAAFCNPPALRPSLLPARRASAPEPRVQMVQKPPTVKEQLAHLCDGTVSHHEALLDEQLERADSLEGTGHDLGSSRHGFLDIDIENSRVLVVNRLGGVAPTQITRSQSLPCTPPAGPWIPGIPMISSMADSPAMAPSPPTGMCRRTAALLAHPPARQLAPRPAKAPGLEAQMTL
eukprot:TRINITY_DN16690_c0_g1_i1.p1 TRINITY_DN16690_c0_g1~~TRINITY_DN16690_c0_g1_i1.p1  ORF type:complete len:366 (+),score=70.71 TRINITY_DN16690_c0_g1_i1:116-1099(+)